MNEEYDFYAMGIRHALDGILSLKKTAKEIEKEYGADARMEFEAGISVTIPEYYNVNIQMDLDGMTRESKNYGLSGLKDERLESYDEPNQGRSR